MDALSNEESVRLERSLLDEQPFRSVQIRKVVIIYIDFIDIILKKKEFQVRGLKLLLMNGVSDGTWTHDLLGHNQVLPPTELHPPPENSLSFITFVEIFGKI